MSGPSGTRALFVQPILTHYREPFFAQLNGKPEVSVEVWSDHHPTGSLRHFPTERFATKHVPEASRGPFLLQPALLSAARTSSHDVVVFPWNTRYLHLGPALAAARLRGIPVLLWGHGYSKREVALGKMARNFLGRRADGCVVYSFWARDRLLADGLSSDRVFVAPNAVPDQASRVAQTFFEEHPDALTRFVREHHLEGRKVALFVSRLERDKGVDFLLDAFERVRQRVPSALLVVVGDGGDKERLTRITESLGLSGHVRFLGKIYDEKRLAPWMLSAQLLAYPSNIGLSLQHALGYGLPVVTSADPKRHNPEFEDLTPGENGLVYRDDDVEDFAKKIVQVFLDRALQARLSQGARASATKPGGHNMTSMVDSFASALFDVTRNKGRT